MGGLTMKKVIKAAQKPSDRMKLVQEIKSMLIGDVEDNIAMRYSPYILDEPTGSMQQWTNNLNAARSAYAAALADCIQNIEAE